MTKYSFTQLEDLWIQAGGNAQSAPMAAAIAMAESGGNSDATHTNSNGTVDRGLWQINSIHGSLSVLDPLNNAKSAVSISKNGTTWRPWCTAWSNGACGGTYLSTTAPFYKFLPSGASTGSNAASIGADTLQTAFDTQNVLGTNLLDPKAWANAFLGPISVWALYGLMVMFGVFITGIGIAILLWETKPVQMAKDAALGAISFGAIKPKG